MQQMVSEPSILGKERRLEAQCEELVEGWRRTEAKLDALKELILDLSFSIQGRSTATAEKQLGSRESLVREEEDLQYEARRQQSEARSAMADTESSSELHEKGDTITELRSLKQVSPIRDYQPFNPLPQVEGLGFDSLESHDGGLDVHQAKVTMDPDSGSHESHEEGEPPPISITTLVQTEGSLGKQKEEKVSSIDLQLCILSSYQKSTSYVVEISDVELERIVVPPRFKDKECEGVVFKCSDYLPFPDSQQLKNAGSLPTARQNASVRKLALILPISAYYCVSLSWLLIWDPKPMVKMKYRAVLTASWISDIDLSRHIVIESLRQLNGDEDAFDFVDFFSRFSLNYVSLGLLWRGTSMLAASSLAVTSVFGKDYISNRIDIGSPRIGIDHIDGLVEQHCSVVEDEQYCSASSLDLSKKRFEVADVINTKFLNKKRWLQRLKEDKGENGWMSIVYLFDGYEVVMRHDPFEVFVRGSGENGKEVLSSNGLFEFELLREKEEMEDWGGRFSIHERPYGSLGKSQGNLEFFSLNGAKMQVNVLETARNEEFSSMMLMLLADQKRDDTLWMSEGSVMKTCQPSDIVWWVSIWFPKPTVKMKHERLGSGIPCGQGILWGVDCYDHNLRRERNATSAGVPRQLKQK